MPVQQYPFIDVAVHESVRGRFARGEALVLFSAGLEQVLWANGAGARFFGNGSIYDFLDQGPDRGDLAFRQIESTARQLQKVGDQRSLLLRLTQGFQRVPVQATAEMVEIRSGEPVVLLAIPPTGRRPSVDECASEMLTGLDDPDTHMAMLAADGRIIAASPAFSGLSITPQTARTLVALVDADRDRLVKRPIPTGRGYLPAAIGKVADEPALYLLFAVETILGNLDPSGGFEEPAAEVAAPEEPQVEDAAADYGAVVDAIGDIEEIETPPEVLTPEAETTETKEVAVEETAPAVAATPEFPTEQTTTAAEAAIEEEEPRQKAELPMPAEAPAVSEPEVSTTGATSDRDFAYRPSSRASRFVWKIDAEGRFSEVSKEFAEAVGPHSAAIEGRTFVEVAQTFNLDPEGKIADLLKRRDTWSGRTVFWPVEGTTLRVPVDLAALPTYDRNRDFDGFRGFGIVRLADATVDAAGTGLALGAPSEDVSPADGEPAAEPPEAAAAEPSQTSVPAETAAEQEERPRPESEPPALLISETPGKRHSDKVVQIEERRARGRDGLTPVEQAAFREIARRLEASGLIGAGAPQQEETRDGAAEPPVAEPGQPEPEAPVAETEEKTAAVTEMPAESTPAQPAKELSPTASTALPRSRRDIGLSPDVIDLMPVALLVHVGDRLIHANPEFLNLTGYGSLDALAEAGGLDALLQRQELEGAAEQASGMVVVRADDQLVPVTARLQSVRWEQSSALLLALIPTEAPVKAARPPVQLTVVEPVPKPADENHALKAEIEELRAILETATDGVVVLGPEGDVRSMNRAASALFNFDEAETRGKPFVMLFAHESQKAVLDYLAGLAGHGVASVLNDGREVIGREASGGFLPLFMTIGKLAASNGYCAVIRDITQWKRTEEELRNAKRAAETANTHKSDFLARVSHEIRTPLNAIIGFADMMAGERFGPIGHPRYTEYANDIVRSGRHVLDIVNDLLDISKIEAGEMELDFEAVGLNEAVASAVSLVQPQANTQRVIIRTALSQSVPNVVADLRSIKQIVLNILANAIRFTPSGGQIIVSTSYESNGSVVLRIRDTGIGMSRTELEMAMKPFRQVAAGGRGRSDGTGLGLPLTKAMVDANRASFAIHSAPNEGTLVEIIFPSPRVLAN
ncbi:PAS/PAC sensor signal transduction histidine kinase [Ciceribacter lividus]|uniref:histidine kinase n=1 Tax=Ciceribacter lividus TaxID=1197950 RepID=A0A6I7HQR6_9HYPH|nr:ATP-binding protein [Ciceribacter lividus]RCW27317.1 PAS/PAC sensor signal transduction histidine kinase [Ciceribacter lividus]